MLSYLSSEGRKRVEPLRSSNRYPARCFILAVVAWLRSVVRAVPTESASSSDIEVSSKLFKDRDSGNSNPDMFLARLLSVDLWRYSPPDAQKIFRIFTE